MKVWDEISIAGEFTEWEAATQDERRKVMNTLEKYNIELCEIEQWKNKQWIILAQIVKECRQREYSVMKRIVEAIKKEREEESNKENHREEEITNQPTTSNRNRNTVEPTNNNQRISHPPITKSPPQEKKESAGQGA